ncbi:3-hydroxyacyl-CoA dehydrogenase family protein [Xylanimonas allomyrinae]|uniref:3-hydroxyacyl-CoA dehydrogenase family protein n=1 Tax=Xylanimonas allomyrinae TaxID=2509459 RepID=A0A4P6ESS1_9MICO|nr:3-hydroxyacyl-CoA dehydrogenase family protein [Xylanimonas allomyrinae]QAY64609.1 3-hydroxyacyl-CoA dehydrogenase family protein [Xylanimonas allomyrinae]
MNGSVPAHVGVLGAGRMGSGIAHAFLLAGSAVTIVDRDDAAADAGRARVARAVALSVARGTTHEDETALMDRLETRTDVAAFAPAGLVVEAVPEDVDLKTDALRRVEDAIGPGAVLASNTSSISIDLLAGLLRRPAAFVGMHFFNPVPASSLVEVVQGAATAAVTTERACAWVEAVRKTPIVVNDAPGFASSRLGVAIGVEAIRMVEEGVAGVADVDAAMTLGYKHPVGPLRLTDLVGLDVRLGIAEYLESRLGPRFAPPALLRELVAAGHLGRKTGRGFYTWDDDGAGVPVEVSRLVGAGALR